MASQPLSDSCNNLTRFVQVVAKEIRNIHPLLFQRLDDNQLDRLFPYFVECLHFVGCRFLRALPFLRRWLSFCLSSCLLAMLGRLSLGRWLFGSETLKAQWPPTDEFRSFFLLTGGSAASVDRGNDVSALRQ